MRNNKPSQGAAVARSDWSMNHFTPGVTATPPKESPVEATEIAIARRRWYHRVTTVVTGTSPAAAKPTA